jgi:hypothetical protein
MDTVRVPLTVVNACEKAFANRQDAETEVRRFVEEHGVGRLHQLISDGPPTSLLGVPSKCDVMAVMAMLSLSLVHKIRPEEFTLLLRRAALGEL